MAKKQDWSREEQAVQAVQMAFDLSNDIQRKVLHLPYRKGRARPRLTVTLKDEDFELLARKYELDPQDRAAIRQRVAEELQGFARQYLTASDQ